MGERGEIEKRGYEFVDSWVGERERGANGGEAFSLRRVETHPRLKTCINNFFHTSFWTRGL
jgi:hypothetical protein